MGNTRELIGEQGTLDALAADTLEELEEDGIREIPAGAFNYRRHLKRVVLPSATSLAYRAFVCCTELEKLELRSKEKVTLGEFQERCQKMNSLCIFSREMSSLSSVRNLRQTPIASGAGAVYVPSEMLNEYRADPKWSHFAIWDAADMNPDSFDTIHDDWETIASYSENHSILDHYRLGDIKSLQVGNKTYHMRLVKADGDTLSENPDLKAGSTWLSMQSDYLQTVNDKKTAIQISPEYPWTQDQNDPTTWISTNTGKPSTVSSYVWGVSAENKGKIQIAYKVSSENRNDTLVIVAGNRTICLKKSGELDWQNAEINLDAGETLLIAARYAKNASNNIGDDKGSIRFTCDDGISIAPAAEGDILYYGGMIGGWTNTEIALNTLPALFELFPDTMKAKIKKVTKTYWDAHEQMLKSADAILWIPSAWELGLQGYENEGVQYDEIFSNADTRVFFHMSDGDCGDTCLRSAYNDSCYCTTRDNGIGGSRDTTLSGYFLLGFCL